jgi:hypothetical protein
MELLSHCLPFRSEPRRPVEELLACTGRCLDARLANLSAIAMLRVSREQRHRGTCTPRGAPNQLRFREELKKSARSRSRLADVAAADVTRSPCPSHAEQQQRSQPIDRRDPAGKDRAGSYDREKKSSFPNGRTQYSACAVVMGRLLKAGHCSSARPTAALGAPWATTVRKGGGAGLASREASPVECATSAAHPRLSSRPRRHSTVGVVGRTSPQARRIAEGIAGGTPRQHAGEP